MTPRTRGLLRRKVKSKDETLPSIVPKRTENTHNSVLTTKKWTTKTKSKWIRVGVILITLFLWKRIALYNRLRRNITSYLVSQSESQEGVLWRGTIQKEDFSPLLLTSTTTTISDSTTKIDLVVSHCDRPLNWIFDEWASSFAFESIRIFSKCNKPVVGAPSNAEIIQLKNVGRCDHTYAHYIVQHYNKDDDGNKDRFTLFLKDNDNSNRDVVSRHRSLAEMVAISKRDGFACHEEQSWDWSHKSLFFDKEYRPICQFSAYSNWKRLQQFSRQEYSRLKRDQNTNFKSVYGDTLGDYANQMGITVTNEIVPVCFGGNFMAQSNQTKKQSIETWKRIDQSLSRGNNIAEGHYVERLWAILLARDLPKGVEIQLLKQQRSSCEPPEHFLGILTK